MTKIKRLVAIVLAFVMIFAVSNIAFAKTQEEAQEQIVATITVCCKPENLLWGHVWIYVENLTQATMKIGHYSLPAGKGVSIGTFAISRDDGWGIYYNVESYSATAYGLDGYTTLTEELTMSEVQTLSEEVYSYVNTWNHFTNCAYFAFKMWNSVSDIFLVPVIFPIFGQLQMLLYDYETGEPKMQNVTADRVYRQIGTGDSAYLVPVSEGSLDPL